MYQKLLLFVFTCMLPFAANSTAEEVISEKRIGVAMRMIGHEVLLCLGDTESRIMPIEKIDAHYKIPFEFEFGFDPDDIISIIDRVIKETRIATNYLVEVEQCETKEVVHSFEIGNAVYSDLAVCRGRLLPEDCYSLLITILDGTDPCLDDGQAAANLPVATSDNSSVNSNPPSEELSPDGASLTALEAKNADPLKIAFFIVPLLFLIGFMSFFIRNRDSGIPESLATEADPNLILVGASLFDKRNMVLSFENKSVELSNKEAELLSLLHSSANAPIKREVILQRVWGDEGDYVGRTLDVFISKLRKKLEGDASVKIINLRGVGYKLVMDVPR